MLQKELAPGYINKRSELMLLNAKGARPMCPTPSTKQWNATSRYPMRGAPCRSYRCLTQCGNTAKQCRIPATELSSSSLVDVYVRVATRSKKDIRNEKEEAERELGKRGFVLPRTVQEGIAMRVVFQDFEGGKRKDIPAEYLRKPPLPKHMPAPTPLMPIDGPIAERTAG